MKIFAEHLVFVWENNGPDRYQTLKRVIETDGDRYFIINSNGSFTSIGNIAFIKYRAETLELISKVDVKSSKPVIRKLTKD